MKIDDIELTDEMVLFHEQRMERHIESVNEILRNANSKNANQIMSFPLTLAISNALSHDSDKCMGGEVYGLYVLINWMYKERKNGREFPYTKSMKEATRKHVMDNLHHPEAWDKRYETNFELFDTGKNRDAVAQVAVNARAMDAQYLVEMVADWKATGLERNNLARSWYNMNVPHRLEFTDLQKYFIEEMLNLVEG